MKYLAIIVFICSVGTIFAQEGISLDAIGDYKNILRRSESQIFRLIEDEGLNFSEQDRKNWKKQFRRWGFTISFIQRFERYLKIGSIEKAGKAFPKTPPKRPSSPGNIVLPPTKPDNAKVASPPRNPEEAGLLRTRVVVLENEVKRLAEENQKLQKSLGSFTAKLDAMAARLDKLQQPPAAQRRIRVINKANGSFLSLMIDAKQRIFLENEEVPLPWLTDRIRAQAVRNNIKMLVVAADTNVSYGWVLQVLDAVYRADLEYVHLKLRN